LNWEIYDKKIRMKNCFFTLIFLSFIIGMNAQTVTLPDYRWLPVEAKGDVMKANSNEI